MKKSFVSVLIISMFLISSIGVVAFAGFDPTPFKNQVGAVCNALSSIDMRLEMVLMKHSKMPAQQGIIGRLDGMANQLEVLDKKAMKLLSRLSKEAKSTQYQTEESIETVGEISVHIADLARVGFPEPPDNLIVMEKLGGIKTLAEKITRRVHVYVAALWDKVIPIRFVQVLKCDPGVCDPPLDYGPLLAAVGGANEAFGEAGLHFVIKSVEQYYLYPFAHGTFPIDSTLDWYHAKTEFEQVFPISDPPDIPPDRHANEWVRYMSTVFSDPTELLVWIFGYDSLVSRQEGHHSLSSFPNGGRHLIISAQNIYDPDRPKLPNPQPALSPYNLAHELGHFFGVRHVWAIPTGINPYTGAAVDWPDLWDLIYCPGDLLPYPIYFSSKDDVVHADCFFQLIQNREPPNCLVNNRYGSDDSDMECLIEIEGIQNSFYSGDPLMKGLSFNLGAIEDPPTDVEDDTYSFSWGLNVMGYYGYYNAHLWTPGRFSASQLDLIRGHAYNNVPITEDADFYFPFSDLWSQRNLLGVE